MKLKCIFCVLLSAIFASLAFAVEPTKDSIDTIKSKLNNKEAMLLDVREESEWNDGHIIGATSLPLSKLKEMPASVSPDFSKETTLYVHCKSGKRALKASEILEEKGYKDVRSLPQSYRELVAGGFKEIK